MKPSNKTLIVFFGVILSYTLMAFAEIRIRGEHKDLTEKNSIAEVAPLENLKYVVIPEDIEKKITISSSNKPRIELKSQSGDIISRMNYKFKNDTLTLQEFDMGENEEHFHMTVFVPITGFEGLSTTSSDLSFLDLKQASLSIIQTGGRVTFQRDIEIEKLSIWGKDDATFNIYSSSIDTIAVDLDNSDLSIRSEVNRLEGYLVNKAALSAEGVNDMQLKKDKGSSIRIFD